MSLVSIVIPAFNYGRYLADAIDSCLAQTYQNIEIIIVDDGSTDNTKQVVEVYSGVPFIHYIWQNNSGLSSARNAGICAAQGEYIHLLDADDVLIPSRLEQGCLLFQNGADFVYSNHEIRTEDLSAPYALLGDKQEIPENPSFQQLIAMRSAPFAPSAVTFRRSIWKAVDGFDERLRAAEDWHFWIKLALYGIKFHRISQSLVWCRWTPGSLSKQRLLLAAELLKAHILLKDLRLPAEIDLNHYIANRHHVLAMNLWRNGQAGAAREHLRQAINLEPRGKYARYVLIFWSRWLSATRAESLFSQMDTVRQAVLKIAE